jgi:hypothetical protein
MWPYKFVLICLIVFMLYPILQFSQTFNRRQLTGLYSAETGGGTWHEPSIIPATYFKLKIKLWGRAVLKEKNAMVSYRTKYWFFTSRPKEWGKFRGNWKLDGDSLILKLKYNRRLGTRETFHIQFCGDYKVLGLWKIYRMRLTSADLSFLKVWKGDEER